MAIQSVAEDARAIVDDAGASGIYLDCGLEHVEASLRYRIVRLRTILRFAKEPRVIAGLKEVIADAENRLVALERRR
jgi:hypothetical protein